MNTNFTYAFRWHLNDSTAVIDYAIKPKQHNTKYSNQWQHTYLSDNFDTCISTADRPTGFVCTNSFLGLLGGCTHCQYCVNGLWRPAHHDK